MYEPLETTVQPNQQVWITKIQSKPQIHEVILRENQEDSCPPLVVHLTLLLMLVLVAV